MINKYVEDTLRRTYYSFPEKCHPKSDVETSNNFSFLKKK